jgi:hypothetical protein
MSANLEACTITQEHPSNRRDLKAEIEAVETNQPLAIDQLHHLLSVDPNALQSYKALRVAIPIIMFSGYVATYAITHQEIFPINRVTELPWVVNGALQAIHALSNNSAQEPYLAYHVPFIFLELSGISSVAGVWDFLNKRGLASRAREAKILLQNRIKEGTQTYTMPHSHTAVFEGQGDWIAEALQQRRQTDVMRYASVPVDSTIWQLFDPVLGDEHLSQALKRADFQSAGEILLLPTMKQHLFLPDPIRHKDMSLDEMEDLVGFVDSESDGKKRVIIVGSGKFSDEHVSTHLMNGTVDKSSKTLDQLVVELEEARGASVQLIDPTQLIMQRIFNLASGRPLVFSANAQGDVEYKARFQTEVQEAERFGRYTPDTSLSEVRVVYNVDDAPTRVQAKSGDIVVILDSRKRAKLIERGIPEDHILCVPEIVLDKVDQEVSE